MSLGIAFEVRFLLFKAGIEQRHAQQQLKVFTPTHEKPEKSNKQTNKQTTWKLSNKQKKRNTPGDMPPGFLFGNIREMTFSVKRDV